MMLQAARNSFGAIAALCLSTGGALYWTVLEDLTIGSYGVPAVKKKLQFFQEERSLDAKTLELTRNVEDYLLMKNVNISSLADVEYFWSKSPDVVAIGSCMLRQTSYIGLPASFSLQKRDSIKISTENSECKDRHLPVFILSDAAKKFAIASGYYQLDSSDIYLKFAVTAVFGSQFGSLYVLAFVMFRQMGFLGLAYGVLCLTGWALLYYYANKTLKAYKIYTADNFAANLGDDFLQGGILYFDEILERNKSINKLQHGQGPMAYDADGNQICRWFEIPEPQLSSRQQKLIDLEKTKKLTEESS